MNTELKFTQQTKTLIEIALAEDLGGGDLTSEALIPSEARAKAVILSRSDLVVCGQTVAERVFKTIDPALSYRTLAFDGKHVRAETVIAEIEGSLRTILAGERTVLNFMQRMSGIATHVAALRAFVGDSPKLLDTRKTTPGMRELEKYSVQIGGGQNHRAGLFDQVLIKNNHIDAIGGDAALAVRTAREKVPKGIIIEVEVRTIEELRSALQSDPDIVLLDNMSPEQMTIAVLEARKLAPQVKLEASGGITDETLAAYAKTGVDYISMGSLTHSVRSADISLRIENEKTSYQR